MALKAAVVRARASGLTQEAELGEAKLAKLSSQPPARQGTGSTAARQGAADGAATSKSPRKRERKKREKAAATQEAAPRAPPATQPTRSASVAALAKKKKEPEKARPRTVAPKQRESKKRTDLAAPKDKEKETAATARPSLISLWCIHLTRAEIEWCRCHHVVCMARPYEEPHHSGRAES